MSIKTLSKKMLAIVAAGAMTMGLAMPTSVFAAEGDTATTKATEAYISKTFNTEVGKNETFSFKAEQVGDNTAKVTIPDINFKETETGSRTKRAQVSFPTNWPDAGKYEYTVTETGAVPAITDTKHQTMIMSKAKYTMDVYVTNGDNGLEISNIIVTKKQDDKGTVADVKVDFSNTDKNTFNFTNTYVQEAGTGTDPTDPDPTYNKFGSLNVSKKIVNANGTTTTPDDEFAFTATFAFPTGTDANTLGGIKAANGDTVTSVEGGTYTFKLKANENMKFTGVPVGTTITVKESAAKNYKGSAEITINGTKLTPVAETSYNRELTAVNSQKLGQKQNTVDVTNTYNDVPVTGIIMNTLPYVLMIALCGVALIAFVGFKRRRLQK